MKNEQKIPEKTKQEVVRKVKEVIATQEHEPLSWKDAWAFPLTKIVVVAGSIYGLLYVSRYFLDVSAEMIRSVKKVRRAMNE